MNYESLPLEIQHTFMINLDLQDLRNLSQTCSRYTDILSEKYDYLWKTLTCNLLECTYNNLGDFNKVNRSEFNSWYELYTYIHTFDIKSLHILCREGRIDLVKYFVTLGNNIDVYSYETGILVNACRAGHLDVVQFLIDCGAYIETDLRDICSPIFTCCSYDHEHMLEYFITQGISVDIDRALYCALFSGSFKIVRYIFENYQKVTANNIEQLAHECLLHRHVNIAKYLIEKCDDVTEKNINEILVTSSCFGRLEMVKYCIEHGADVTYKNFKPIVEASQNENEDVLEYFASIIKKN